MMKFNTKTFLMRLKYLYCIWKNNEYENVLPSITNVDALICAVGKNCKDQLTLQTILYGYAFENIISVFTYEEVYIIANKKLVEFLKPALNIKDSDCPSVKLITRQRNGNIKNSFNELIKTIKSSKNGKLIGVFKKEKSSGVFIDAWTSVFNKQSFLTVDISTVIDFILTIKDESEITLIKTAGLMADKMFSEHLKKQITEIIYSNKKVKHVEIVERLKRALKEEIQLPEDVDPSWLKFCYPPIIQSGGNYSLKFPTTNDECILNFGVIVCSLGIRYKIYCSNVIRTILVNPTEEIKRNYEFLLNLQDVLVSKLKCGTKLCDVYNYGVRYTEEKNQSLVAFLTKDFGHIICNIGCRENVFMIAPETTVSIKSGQVYCVQVGLTGLTNKNSSNKETNVYALYVGDTVLVNEVNEYFTDNSERSITVSYNPRKRKGINHNTYDIAELDRAMAEAIQSFEEDDERERKKECKKKSKFNFETT